MSKLYDFDNTIRVQRVDGQLYVVYDTDIDRYEVHDRAAPGGEAHSLVMRVMNEDGSYRPVDQRTIDTLYRLRHQLVNQGVEGVKRELREQERKRSDGVKRSWGDWAYGLVDAIKWAGRDVVPSTAWRDRADPSANPSAKQRRREEIAALGRS